jgi:hypothetical protein
LLADFPGYDYLVFGGSGHSFHRFTFPYRYEIVGKLYR